MKYIINIPILLIIVACSPGKSQEMHSEESVDFNTYWYAGEAEISSYELEQVRYGEIHKGKAVLVFVTEPFSKSKQVKLDDWRDQSSDNVSVMKLNLTKKFITGIYPYSMMMSTFTPVSYDQHPSTFKVTTSSQEWCGHTFMQLNLQKDGYLLRGFSYFESEGDVDIKVEKVVLEDELWTRIRLDPENLPIGEFEVLPSTFYLRLRHRETQPITATAEMKIIDESAYSDQKHLSYELEYEDRSLKIFFEEMAPYRILGWEETHLSGYGNPEKLTTKARHIKTIKSPYWEKNSNSDRVLRKELGLDVD